VTPEIYRLHPATFHRQLEESKSTKEGLNQDWLMLSLKTNWKRKEQATQS
jgi:hypothetical protein